MTSPLLPDTGHDGRLPSQDDPAQGAAPATAPQVSIPLPPRNIKFPLGWILENASVPLQYRAIMEVAKLPELLPGKGQDVPLANQDALVLAVTQRGDGVWHDAMLSTPDPKAKHFAGVGTVQATRRLLEYGWSKDTPPVACSRRILFRLLAEDDSPEYLYELGQGVSLNEDIVRRGRGLLREAAAAALAQAGYEGDPRLRGAARRIIDRVAAYLRSPLAQKPFARYGNQHALPPEAAPPSMYSLAMLAHMPLFRQEHYDAMERLYDHLSRPAPKMETVQMCGGELLPQPHLVMGDMLLTRNAGDADIPFAMHWLELMARLGFLKRNEGWSKIYDRYLDSCDAQGVFKPTKGMAFTSTNPFTWHMFPLDTRNEPGVADVTFRLGLIGRVAGRTIDVA